MTVYLSVNNLVLILHKFYAQQFFLKHQTTIIAQFLQFFRINLKNNQGLYSQVLRTRCQTVEDKYKDNSS